MLNRADNILCHMQALESLLLLEDFLLIYAVKMRKTRTPINTSTYTVHMLFTLQKGSVQ